MRSIKKLALSSLMATALFGFLTCQLFASNLLPTFTDYSSAQTLSLTYTQTKPTTPLTATAVAAWNQTGLFIQITVNDATQYLSNNLNRDFSNQDHVIIGVNPINTQLQDVPGANDYIFIITPLNYFGQPMLTSYAYGGHEHLELDLRLINYAVERNANGYIVTVNLPWKLFSHTKPPQTIALSVTIRDADQTGIQQYLSTSSQFASPSSWTIYKLNAK